MTPDEEVDWERTSEPDDERPVEPEDELDDDS
jgi:hypothetical protein